MTRVDARALAARLPELLDRVEEGEQIAITRNGLAVADLVPRATADKRTGRGVWRGMVDITADNAFDAASLPRHHGDPFDRLLVAQAQAEAATLVTDDEVLSAYDVLIMPVSG